MKFINQGDQLVKTVLGIHRIQSDVCYRWSIYSIPHTMAGKKYLYHNFTKKIVLLEDDGVDFEKNRRYTAEEVKADKVLLQLAESFFLVPEHKNEAESYVSFCKIARALKMKKEGYSSFTILPTTACNARCVYCFEQGMKYVTMKRETVDQLIRFIKENRNPNRTVHFSWFGGEPLIGKRIIDRICAAMRAEDIPFSSRMITNGSLVSNEIIRKMQEEWNLKVLQITLDGTEEQYNLRKNYYYDYRSAYWHVLSRIKMLNENGMSINIRVNLDQDNIESVPQMVEDLSNFITNRKSVRLDLTPLFDVQADVDGISVWKRSFELCDLIQSKGFMVNYHYHVIKCRYNFCMADAPYKALVVDPEGVLHNCEHIKIGEPLGDIWNGVTKTERIKKHAGVAPVQERCRNCFSLPACTTATVCEQDRVNCRYAAGERLKRSLDIFIPSLEAKRAMEEESDDEDESDIC